MKIWFAAAITVIVLCGACVRICADDGAAEIAAGSLQLRKEGRISMEKERLVISEKKIKVELEFLNETDRDIIPEVAFPIPPYAASDDEGNPRGTFSDFRIWVEGSERSYQTEARAKLNGSDYTDLFTRMNIDIATFAHVGDLTVQVLPVEFQIPKLPKQDKESLVNLGLLDAHGIPTRHVEKMYHWSQRFPAHQAIHIRHEYAPIEGFGGVEVEKLSTELKNACVEPALQNRLRAMVAEQLKQQPTGGSYVSPMWIKYILKSANTWKTPIKDFSLVVERPAPSRGNPAFVSFCWDGPVQRIDDDHFAAHKSKFIPADDLIIYYIWAAR